MDFLKQLGELALGSRLKRMSDMLMRDVATIYKTLGVDFEPTLMPVLNFLHQRGKASVSEIAGELRLSQPAVTQFCNALKSRGLISLKKDTKDQRKKVVTINSKGKILIEKMQPLWLVIQQEIAAIIHLSLIHI